MFSISYGPTRILLFVAIVPAIAMLLFVYYRDKKEKEPVKLIALLMGMGAATIIPAAIIETIGQLLLDNTSLSENAYYWIYCICVIGVAEELGKLLVCIIPTWKSKEFKHSYDAVVYAVASSLGFAIVENITYVIAGGLGLGILRAFTALPLHCVLGVVMGTLYAKAREAAYKYDSSMTAAYMVLAYIVPVLIHGIYDYFAMMGETGWIVVILIFAYAGAVFLILYCSKNDHRIDGKPETADYGVYGTKYRYQNNVPPYGQNYGYNQNQNTGYRQNPYSSYYQNSNKEQNNYTYNPYRKDTDSDDTTDNQ